MDPEASPDGGPDDRRFRAPMESACRFLRLNLVQDGESTLRRPSRASSSISGVEMHDVTVDPHALISEAVDTR